MIDWRNKKIEYDKLDQYTRSHLIDFIMARTQQVENDDLLLMKIFEVVFPDKYITVLLKRNDKNQETIFGIEPSNINRAPTTRKDFTARGSAVSGESTS